MLTTNSKLEQMVDEMASVLPAVNRDIHYAMVLNQLASLACRCWLKVEATKASVFPNCYALVFSRMGGGKDRAYNEVEAQFFADANAFLCREEQQAYLGLQGKLSNDACKAYPNEAEGKPSPALTIARRKYIEDRMPRQLMGVINKATSEGITADRQAIKEHGLGCVRVVDSEFGDMLRNMREQQRDFLSYMKDVWDKGDSKDKSIKGDKGSKQVSGVPCNYLAFTTLSHLVEDKRAKHELINMFKSGWTRRGLVVFDSKLPTFVADATEGGAMREIEACHKASASRDEWNTLFLSIAVKYNPRGRSTGQVLAYSKEAEVAFFVYKNQCLNERLTLVNKVGFDTNESEGVASLAWLTFRTAGLFALLNETSEVSLEDFNNAKVLCRRFFNQAVELERFLRQEKASATDVYQDVFKQMVEGMVFNKGQLRLAIGKGEKYDVTETCKVLADMADERGFMLVEAKAKGRDARSYSLAQKVRSEAVPVAMSVSDEITEGFEWCEKDAVESLETAIALACTKNYSPSQFKNGYRKAENWLGGNTMLVFDVDDGTTLEQAESMFFDTACALLPSRNHQKQKGKQEPRDRFRVFLPLLEPMDFKDPNRFKRIMQNVAKSFGLQFDEQTKDCSRFYFPSPLEALEAVWYSEHRGNYVDWRDFDHEEMGKLETAIVTRKHNSTYSPSLGDDKEFVRRCLVKFMDTHFREGNRNNALFRACSWLKDAGFSEAEASAVLEANMQNPLPRDEERRTIRQVFKK